MFIYQKARNQFLPIGQNDIVQHIAPFFGNSIYFLVDFLAINFFSSRKHLVPISIHYKIFQWPFITPPKPSMTDMWMNYKGEHRRWPQNTVARPILSLFASKKSRICQLNAPFLSLTVHILHRVPTTSSLACHYLFHSRIFQQSFSFLMGFQHLLILQKFSLHWMQSETGEG